MVWKPRVTVASVIEQEGRFLMVEELIHGQPTINQPAGHMEHGESLLDAVRRETLEETGYRFEPTALLGIFHLQRPDPEQVYLRFTFTGKLLGVVPEHPLDQDIHAVHWLTREQIYAQDHWAWRSGLVGRALQAYDAGIRLPLDSLHYLVSDA